MRSSKSEEHIARSEQLRRAQYDSMVKSDLSAVPQRGSRASSGRA